MKASATNLISRVERALSRETSSGSFIPEIDGLRFIAVSLVVLYHATYYLAPEASRVYRAIASHGNFGVQLFFVISGFILALPFAKHHLQVDGDRGKRVDLRRYFLRRLTRLEPPYLINLFFWFWIKVLLLHRGARALWPHLAASVFYSHNWIYGGPSEINFYAWSLEVEVQFYILAPLLTTVFRIESRNVRRTILSLLVLAFSAQRIGLSEADHAFQYLTFFGQAEWFLTGLLLADIYLADWKERPAQGVAWNPVGIASWPLIIVGLTVQSSSWRGAWLAGPAMPWLVLLAYVTAFRSPIVNTIVRLRPIYVIGGMCYSIYLYQGYVVTSVMQAQQRFFETKNLTLDTLFGLTAISIAILTVCGLVFVLFEKPFMRRTWPSDFKRWASRVFGRRQGA